MADYSIVHIRRHSSAHFQPAIDSNGTPCTMVLVEPIHRIDRPETLQRMGLTPREAAVALGLLRGADVRTLAREAGVSPHTVIHQQRSVFEKLGVSSRHGLMTRLYAGF